MREIASVFAFRHFPFPVLLCTMHLGRSQCCHLLNKKNAVLWTLFLHSYWLTPCNLTPETRQCAFFGFFRAYCTASFPPDQTSQSPLGVLPRTWQSLNFNAIWTRLIRMLSTVSHALDHWQRSSCLAAGIQSILFIKRHYYINRTGLKQRVVHKGRNQNWNEQLSETNFKYRNHALHCSLTGNHSIKKMFRDSLKEPSRKRVNVSCQYWSRNEQSRHQR